MTISVSSLLSDKEGAQARSLQDLGGLVPREASCHTREPAQPLPTLGHAPCH